MKPCIGLDRTRPLHARWSFVLPAACGLFASLAVYGQEDAVVHLIPDATTIRVGDPVFVKVLVRNSGRDSIRINPTLSSGVGTVRFELRRLHTTDYLTAPTGSQGVVCMITDEPLEVPPGETRVQFESLFLYRDRPSFADPGIYELRAAVQTEDGPIVSDPVEMTVAPMPVGEEVTVKASVPFVGGNAALSTDRLSEIQERLTDSNLKKVLTWSRLLMELGQAKDSKARKAASDAVDEFRAACDPVTAEVVGMELARRLVEMGQLEEAEHVLSTLKEPTATREGLIQEVRGRKEQETGSRKRDITEEGIKGQKPKT